MQWANRNKYPKDKDDNQSDPSEITGADLIFHFGLSEKGAKTSLLENATEFGSTLLITRSIFTRISH